VNGFTQWLSEVFSHPDALGALVIAGKTAIVYVFLVVGLRLLGRRELGQMTIYDLVLIVVLANSVQNAMVGDDTTLAGGLVAAVTLLLMNRVITLILARSPGLQLRLVGQPLLIVSDGHLLPDAMRREGVSREQVMAALREHGIDKLEDVSMAVLEVDGTISVVPRQATIHRTRRHIRAVRVS
jgi:uncharacterized membrane protein YcaP (DUF421 family)